VGYVNNLIAKFWLSPVTGITLSRIVLKNGNNTSFTSDFGKTRELFEPHEFGYFWIHWLKMKDMPPYIPTDVESKIDWDGLYQTLLNISDAFGKPFAFKALSPGHHIARFAEMLDKALFIYIERDPLDVGLSLYQARMEYYNDPAQWWSMFPPEYDALKDLPYWEQIAGQI
ncbi:MAG: hypothetical protein IH946_10110, partial [Bacteroidetes bacterium]|nr:hypothetical protein [Bacteroidota bacterium]